MKKTILFIVNEVFLHQGGMERFNRHMCMALQRYSKENNLVCLVISKNDISFDKKYINDSPTYKFIGCKGNKILFVIQYLKAIITLKGLKLSIFGILNHVLLATFIPSGVKKVFIIHGFEAWKKLPVLKSNIIHKFSEVWSVSDYTKNEFSQTNSINSSKIKLLKDSLDYYWLENCEKNYKDENFILCVSRLDAEHGDYKGVDNLICSFSKISSYYPQYNLIIVGNGTDINRLQKLAIDADIFHKVKFLESVSDNSLKELYDNCTIFALPSKKEGFGIVFLEAMAARKPVIGGNHGGTPEVIENGKTGLLVNHSNDQELTSALEQLLANQELRLKMGEQGYKKLIENFLYSNFESTLFSYLSDLIEK